MIDGTRLHRCDVCTAASGGTRHLGVLCRNVVNYQPDFSPESNSYNYLGKNVSQNIPKVGNLDYPEFLSPELLTDNRIIVCRFRGPARYTKRCLHKDNNKI